MLPPASARRNLPLAAVDPAIQEMPGGNEKERMIS